MGIWITVDGIESFGLNSYLVRSGKEWENHSIWLFGLKNLCKNEKEFWINDDNYKT